MLYKGNCGTQYDLSPSPIARGGEGAIHNVNGRSDIVAKIYRSDKVSAEKERKLIKMIAHKPDQTMLDQIAWPQDVLYDASRQFAGFVMSKMSVNEDLNVIYEYGSSAKYPDISWENRIRIAENLCAVLHSLHGRGHVCGDLNPKNISVDPNTGYVIFLDTDSYHIQDGVDIYRCDVGIPQYLPVEIQMKMRGGNTLATVQLPTFSQDTDNFALAIHIFQLLMNGVHPFACTIIPNQSSVTAPQPADNIVKGEFPFMQNLPGVKIPPYAPEITILPKNIQSLFERAFIDGHSSPGRRPLPEDWHTALRDLRQSLKQCKQVSHHQFFKNLSDCPLCKADYSFNQTLNKRTSISQTTFTPPAPPSVRPPSSHGATPPISASAPRVKTAKLTAGLLGLVFGAWLFAGLLGLVFGAWLFEFIYMPWAYRDMRELNLIRMVGLFLFTLFAIYGPFNNISGRFRFIAIFLAPIFLHKICTYLAVYGTPFVKQIYIHLDGLYAIIFIGGIIGLQAGYRIGNVVSGTPKIRAIILGIALCLFFFSPFSTFIPLPERVEHLIAQVHGSLGINQIWHLKKRVREGNKKIDQLRKSIKHEQPDRNGEAHKAKVIAQPESRMSWSDAKAYCQRQGGRLPRINNSNSWASANWDKIAHIEAFGAPGDPWPSGLSSDVFWTGTESGTGDSWFVNGLVLEKVLVYTGSQNITNRVVCVR